MSESETRLSFFQRLFAHGRAALAMPMAVRQGRIELDRLTAQNAEALAILAEGLRRLQDENTAARAQASTSQAAIDSTRSLVENLMLRSQEIADAVRLNAGTVSRLAIELQEASLFAKIDKKSSQDVIANELDDKPLPVAAWRDANIPFDLRKALQAKGKEPAADALVLQTGEPGDAFDTSLVLDGLRRVRKSVPPGTPLVLAVQKTVSEAPDASEIEQVFGLVGPVEHIVEIEAGDISWFIVMGRVRQEAAGIVLRWSLPALDSFQQQLAPMMLEMLEQGGLRSVLHGIDLPPAHFDFAYWSQLADRAIRELASAEGACFGLVLPHDFSDRVSDAEESAQRLRQALAPFGKDLVFQWVMGTPPIEASAAIIATCRKLGIAFDMTAVSRHSRERRLEAFDELVPYHPLSFDLRLPSFKPGKREPLEVPRRSGRDHALKALEEGLSLTALFDRDFTQARRRVATMLDRSARKQFEAQVNLDSSLLEYWPDYNVFNWSPPPPASLRLFEFDAQELINPSSPLRRLLRAGLMSQEDPRRLSGEEFLSFARSTADAPVSTQELNSVQVEAHLYLRDRPDVTADAEKIIAWMPQNLGRTLELGSGYGVMARRVGARSSLYVGLDLTTEQAQVLHGLGAKGLVADIHCLPFPDESFDTLIADNVIEHAHDPLAALSECRRVLSAEGRAYIVMPSDYHAPNFRNAAHFWKADDDSVYLAARLAGLKVVRHESVRLAEQGISGAFPSSCGLTGLWELCREEL